MFFFFLPMAVNTLNIFTHSIYPRQNLFLMCVCLCVFVCVCVCVCVCHMFLSVNIK